MLKRLILVAIILLVPSECLVKSTEFGFGDSQSIQHTDNISETFEIDQVHVLGDLSMAKNASKEEILNKANMWVSQLISIPNIGGNWTHYFTCDDGNRLVYDSNESSQFWCESESKWYTGEQYETAWAAFRHREIISIAGFNLAMAHQITNNSSFAETAKDILIQYGDLYPSLKARNKFNTTYGNIAKLTTQSLDEAVLLIDLAWIYQLIKANCNVTEQIHIEENLLLEGVKLLQLESNLKKSPISNWYSYHNAALMMIGSTLQNQTLIDLALDGPSGFKFQLTNGVYEDGLWHEGSISYHNYTLNSMLFVLEAGRKIGLDLYNLTVIDPESNQSRTVKEMFLAPLGMVRPDGYIPRLNDDIRGTNMHDMLRIYELANYIWDDEVFDWALMKAVERGERKSWATYLWGHEIISTNSHPQSRYYEESGIGVLRTENSFLLMDYGPHGGRHGHHDKLSFEFYSHGKERFIDMGVTVYSLPISSEWFRSTLGHSTLMVGNQNQLEAQGTLINFYPFENGGLISASVNNISSEVNSTRHFILLDLENDGVLLLDLMNASSMNLQNYSSIYHGMKEINILSNQTSANSIVPIHAPWSYMKNIEEVSIASESKFRWNLGDNHSVDLYIPEHDSLDTALIAEAPNNPMNGSHDALIINATREIYDIDFRTLIHSRNDSSSEIQNYSLSIMDENYSLQVDFANGRKITLKVSPSHNSVEVSDTQTIQVANTDDRNTTDTNLENLNITDLNQDAEKEENIMEDFVKVQSKDTFLIDSIFILSLTIFLGLVYFYRKRTH